MEEATQDSTITLPGFTYTLYSILVLRPKAKCFSFPLGHGFHLVRCCLMNFLTFKRFYTILVGWMDKEEEKLERRINEDGAWGD